MQNCDDIFYNFFRQVSHEAVLFEEVLDESGSANDFICSEVNNAFLALLPESKFIKGRKISDITKIFKDEQWPHDFVAVLFASENRCIPRICGIRDKQYQISQLVLSATQRAVVLFDATVIIRKSEENSNIRDRLNAIVAFSGSGIILSDENAIITFTNQCMADLIGVTPDSLIGTSYYSLVDEQFKEKSHETIEGFLSGESPYFSGELRYLRKDGSSFWCHVTAARGLNRASSNLWQV